MEHRACTFEVYGFDLILDESLRPWVIEVNLSPACNERTDWLTKMVDDMTLDLLTHVEQRILMQSDADLEGGEAKEKQKRVPNLPPPLCLNLNKENFYTDNDLKHRWIRLKRCIKELTDFNISETIQPPSYNIYPQALSSLSSINSSPNLQKFASHQLPLEVVGTKIEDPAFLDHIPQLQIVKEKRQKTKERL
jgi:hypothetical protein